MPPHKPVNNQQGNFDDLRVDTIDESAPEDPNLGHKPFLVWEKTRNAEGNEIYKAVGKDGTIYIIEEDEPPKPPKKGKITIV